MAKTESELLPCPRCGEREGCVYANDGWFAVECDNCPHRTSNAHRSAEDAIAAWNHRAANSDGGVEPVAVRKLYWEKDLSRQIAQSILGEYAVYPIKGAKGRFGLRIAGSSFPLSFGGIEEAKSEAQEDLNRRIRSAIAHPPAKSLDGIAVTDEMVERAARKIATIHYAERFSLAYDDQQVSRNVDANWIIFDNTARAALTAALK